MNIHGIGRFAFLITLASTSYSQVSDYRLVTPSVAHGIQAVSSGDLDGDGKIDTVTSSSFDGRVVWYRQVSPGVYSQGMELSRDENVGGDLKVVDLDGDSDMDIVFSGFDLATGHPLIWFENSGTGEFTRQTIPLSPGFAAADMVIRDWDGDGILDLLTGNYFEVIAYRGTGPATFATGQSLPTGFQNPSSPVLADLTGDGLDDVLFSTVDDFYPNIPGSLRLFAQLPSGSFGPPDILSNNSSGSYAMVAVDLTGDGALDIVRAGPQLELYPNQGGGSFLPTPTDLGAIPIVSEMVVADVDGDGDEDIVQARTSPPASRSVVELINMQDGTAPLGEVALAPFAEPRNLEVLDHSGDGKPDLMWSSSFRGQVSWNEGVVGAPYEEVISLTETGGEREYELGDFNGDGRLDLVCVRANQFGRIDWFEQRPDGTFKPAQGLPYTGSIYYDPVVDDVNGDGYDDVLISEADFMTDYTNLAWAMGSPGGLTAPQPMWIGTWSENFGPARTLDADMDGDRDVVATSFTLQKITWFENQGNGQWSGRQDFDTVMGIYVNAVADVDGDGDEDVIVTAGDHGDEVFVYENYGIGQFSSRQPVGTALPISFCYAMDVDQDGDEDVLRIYDDGSEGALVWYESLPGFQFGPQQLLVDLNVFFPYYEVRPTDWNADGREDLLIAFGTSRKISWSENLGGGQFGPILELTNRMAQADRFRIGDLDGDQDIDLVMADGSMGAFRWYENLQTLGSVFCSSTANSTGEEATLSVSGSRSATANRMTLTADRLPPNEFGFFLVADQPGFVANPGGSDGNLCLGGAIGRYNQLSEIQFSGLERIIRLDLDLPDTPTPTGPTSIMAGQTWHFQAWFRDNTGGPSSNFSEAVEVTFL